jgi:hypothetical protein
VTTITALIERCQDYLQDRDGSAWLPAVVLTQLLEEITRLGRQEVFGQIVWMQGVAGQALYTFPDTTVAFAELIYNARSLRHASDDALTRLKRDWERQSGTPQYWTDLLQAPQTVRLVPQPLVSGSAVPQMPPLPLVEAERDNLLAFLWEQPQGDETTFALLEVLEDVVVWRTVGALCGQAGDYQDRQKAAVFEKLAQLALDALLGD